METAKHTPGPWEHKHEMVYGQDGNTLAHVRDEANAALIAAAPETAAERDQLKVQRDELLAVAEDALQDIVDDCPSASVEIALRAAIARATKGE